MTSTSTAFPARAAAGPRLADVLVERLARLGVEHCFGIIGGAAAHLADAVGRSTIRFTHMRHEAGAAFAAAEASLATGQPVVVLTTTGPGLLNALNGMIAARWDGAKVILLSAGTNATHRGRLPVQETSRYTMPQDALFAPGQWFDLAASVDDAAEMVDLLRRIELGLLRPQGFTAHISLPAQVQGQSFAILPSATSAVVRASFDVAQVGELAETLRESEVVLWVGSGARHSAEAVRRFVKRTHCKVMMTPRAKGIVSERSSQVLGVTGAGGHEAPARYISQMQRGRVLVLGSRLGEASSNFDPRLVPPQGFVHVDVDTQAFGAAYPQATTLGVEAEIGPFINALADAMSSATDGFPAGPTSSLSIAGGPDGDDEGPLTYRSLMQAIQEVVVDGSEAIVMTESGNAFGFGNHHLRFTEPGRYRTSAAWGSMGHMTTGVIGAALATGKRAVSIVGDGALLMNNEIHSAVTSGARATWVVINNGSFAIVDDGMRGLGLLPEGCTFDRVDFVRMAEAVGCPAVQVRSSAELRQALESSSSLSGPFLIDATVIDDEPSPAIAARLRALRGSG